MEKEPVRRPHRRPTKRRSTQTQKSPMILPVLVIAILAAVAVWQLISCRKPAQDNDAAQSSKEQVIKEQDTQKDEGTTQSADDAAKDGADAKADDKAKDEASTTEGNAAASSTGNNNGSSSTGTSGNGSGTGNATGGNGTSGSGSGSNGSGSNGSGGTNGGGSSYTPSSGGSSGGGSSSSGGSSSGGSTGDSGGSSSGGASGGGTPSAPQVVGSGQALSSANESQLRIVQAAKSTPSAPSGYGARWVESVYANAGFGHFNGNSDDLYNEYCTSSDTNDLKVGMIVAVSTHPQSAEGRTWGHSGIYVGDDQVMDSVDGEVRTISLQEWVSYYGSTVPVQWGWLGNINIA